MARPTGSRRRIENLSGVEMQKSEIKAGEEYGLREARTLDASLQRIRILQHVRGKKCRTGARNAQEWAGLAAQSSGALATMKRRRNGNSVRPSGLRG